MSGSFLVIVAIVAVIGGVFRAWLPRCEIDRRILVRFGALCAVASIAGAVLHNHAPVAVITPERVFKRVLGGVLVATGLLLVLKR